VFSANKEYLLKILFLICSQISIAEIQEKDIIYQNYSPLLVHSK